MTYARTDLEMAVQHIAEAEVRIAEQRRLITRYTALRRDTTLAVSLLGILIQTLDLRIAHRDDIERQLADPA